jgi:hypothetical protein
MNPSERNLIWWKFQLDRRRCHFRTHRLTDGWTDWLQLRTVKQYLLTFSESGKIKIARLTFFEELQYNWSLKISLNSSFPIGFPGINTCRYKGCNNLFSVVDGCIILFPGSWMLYIITLLTFYCGCNASFEAWNRDMEKEKKKQA